MKQWIRLIFLLILLASGSSAQSLSEDLTKVKSIKLLEATADDVIRILGNTSTFMYGQKVFSLPSSRVDVSYSSGRCTDEDAHGVVSDDWNVAEGRVVIVEVLPRENLTVAQLPLGDVRLTKDKLYRRRDDYHIYYNKGEGVAVKTYGEDNYVDAIMFFPSRSSNSLLCRDEKIQKYYAKREWKRDWQPIYVCILRNMYANVDDLSVIPTSDRLFAVTTTARDPENDVLTYNYRVTGGKVSGAGANVVWDLSDSPPGEYSITVGVDDGAGVVGKVITKTVTVK